MHLLSRHLFRFCGRSARRRGMRILQLAIALAAVPAAAQDVAERMEASTVRVEMTAKLRTDQAQLDLYGPVALRLLTVAPNLVELAHGSGFLVDRNYVATNYHVVTLGAEYDLQDLIRSALVISALEGLIVQMSRDHGLAQRVERLINELKSNQQWMSDLAQVLGRPAEPRDHLTYWLLRNVGRLQILVETAPYLAVMVGPRQAVPVSVPWKSQAKDLALVKLSSGTSKPVVKFAPEKLVRKTQTVYVVGFPGVGDRPGSRSSVYEVKFTKGIISAFIQDNSGWRLYQTDAPINPGNSGGPLFNECGEVIGINVQKPAAQAEGVGWAIRVDELLPELVRHGISHQAAGTHCVSSAAASGSMEGALRAQRKREAETEEELAKLRQQLAETEKQAGSQLAALRAMMAQKDEEAEKERAALRQLLLEAQKKAGKKDPVVIGGVIGSLLLGLVAVILASTKRGRAATRSALTHISHTISHSSQAPPPLQPVLEGLAGDYAGYTLELDESPLTIGRDPRVSHLVFPPTADKISKRHCILTYDADKREFVLEDCWSTNGTYLDSDERIDAQKPRRLRPGDRFYLSDRGTAFAVEMKPKK